MNWTPGTGRLRFSLAIFFVVILFSVVIAFLYYYSGRFIDRTTVTQMLLFVGLLVASIISLFAWSLESRRNYLEQQIRIKSQDLFQKNMETKKAEIAAAAIYQTCHILFSQVPFSELLSQVMNLTGKLLYADEASLMLLNSGNELYIAASRGISEEVASRVQIKIGERVAGRAAQMRRDFLIVDGLDKYPEFEGIEPNARIRSSIVCPLLCQNELLGVLNLNRTITRENFTVSDMINVSIFAAQVAQALRTASLFQQLQMKTKQVENLSSKIQQYERSPLDSTG